MAMVEQARARWPMVNPHLKSGAYTCIDGRQKFENPGRGRGFRWRETRSRAQDLWGDSTVRQKTKAIRPQLQAAAGCGLQKKAPPGSKSERRVGD
jgi:hypothetical protein